MIFLIPYSRYIEDNLRAEYYRLFRRTWLITNECSRSAIALSDNTQFIYVFDNEQVYQSPQQPLEGGVCNKTL